MTGLPAPNVTPVPNVIFDELVPIMGNAELRVTFAIIRHTYCWYPEYDRLSINTLARVTGLSRQGVVNGLKAGIARGTLARQRKGMSYTYTIVQEQPVPATRPAWTTSMMLAAIPLGMKSQQCVYCGGRVEEIEHWIPRSRGGTSEKSNLVASCKICNRAKGTMTGEEFVELLIARGWMVNDTKESTPWTGHVHEVDHFSNELDQSASETDGILLTTKDSTKDNLTTIEPIYTDVSLQTVPDKPAKQSRPRDPNLDHPAVKAWYAIRDSGTDWKYHMPALTRSEVAITITADEQRVAHWETIIRKWILRGYQIQTVAGLLDWFKQWELARFDDRFGPWLHNGNRLSNRLDKVELDRDHSTPEQRAAIRAEIEKRRQGNE